MEADGDTFVAMVWDQCSTWKDRSKTGVAGNYGKEIHEKGRTHVCRHETSIESMRYNDPSDNDPASQSLEEVELAPRLLLAFLCWLALRDEGLL